MNGDDGGTSIQMGIHDRSPQRSGHLRALRLLRDLGADRMPHARGRTLAEHLAGTAAVLAAWEQPDTVQRAALLHSIYGTSVYRDAAASHARRDAVRAAIGADSERLVFAFGALDRGAFRAAIATMPQPAACRLRARDGTWLDLGETEVAALTLIGMANEVEQTSEPDGSPASWRACCPSLVAAALRWTTLSLPSWLRTALAVPDRVERETIAAYAGLCRVVDRDERAETDALEHLCGSAWPVAEPYVWHAYVARRRGDAANAARHAAEARRRFVAWGSAWDKRLTLERWLRELDRIADPAALMPRVVLAEAREG